jgi:integrase
MADLILASDAAIEPKDASDLAALRSRAMPDTTRATYRSHWKSFRAWCATKGLESCPASATTLCRYLLYLDRDQGRAVSTARVALAAIHLAHLKKDAESARYAQSVKEALKGIARSQAGRPLAQRAALTTDLLKKVLAVHPPDLTGARDRAILLVGFACALRRSELVKLEFKHIKIPQDAATIFVQSSKTDQEGRGAFVPMYRSKLEELCPVSALAKWLGCLASAGVSEGPIFRKVEADGRIGARALHAGAVYNLVKGSCRAAGIDPKLFGAHSLRAGFITSAYKAGRSLENIAGTSRHVRLDTVRNYIRDVEALKNGAGRGLLDR